MTKDKKDTIKKQNEKGWKGKLSKSKKGMTGSFLPYLAFNFAVMTALYLTVADAENPYAADDPFFDSFLNFTTWGQGTWVAWVTSALFAGAAVLISAQILGWKSEFPIYAGFAGIMFTAFTPVYTTLYNQLSIWWCTDLGANTGEACFMAMLPLAGLAMGWLIVTMEYARGRD